MDLKEKLKICYKKLKSSAYFDKTASILRKQIVEFETENDVDKKIDELAEKLENNGDEWKKYSDTILNSIVVYSYPKKIKAKEKKNFILVNNFDNNSKITIEDDNGIQNNIKLSIEGHILGVLWILLIGSKIDETLIEDSYGNRLVKNFNTKKEEWSPYLYKPYFDSYETWRDKGLNIAEDYYKQGKDCIMIMLDIKRFYYSIDYSEEMFTEFLTLVDASNIELEQMLNKFIYDVISRYSNILNTGSYKNTLLPIGFMPSGILANWYLDNFDKSILDKVHPSYYGRYVDDIIIVDKVENKTLLHKLITEKEFTIEDIMERYFIAKHSIVIKENVHIKKRKFSRLKINWCRSIKSRIIASKFLERLKESKSKNTGNYVINFTDKLHKDTGKKLKVNEEKIKVFYLKSNGTKAVIDKFREEIKKNSSELRLLPESNNLFLDNYNDIYRLEQQDSINKLSGVKNIEINKYELSKFIGKQLVIANLINDNTESKFYEDMDRIFNSRVIIENYLTWESLITLYIVNKRYVDLKKMLKKMKGAIDLVDDNIKSEIDDTKYINIQSTLEEHLFSCLCRALSLIWGENVKNNIIKDTFLEEKYNKINELRNGFCSTRMISKTMMPIFIDMFRVDQSNDDTKFYDEKNKVYLNDMASSLKFIRERMYGKGKIKYIEDCKSDDGGYKYYPYFITMQDITKSLLFSKIIDGEVFLERELNSGNDKESMNDISTSVDVNIIYDCLNYRHKYNDIKEEFNNLGDHKDEGNKKTLIRSITYRDECEDKYYNIIKIGKENKESVTIAIATATLEDENFKSLLLSNPNRSFKRYEQLADIINQAVKNNVEILFLPENYVPFEWLPLLEREVKKNQIAIITGVEHVKAGYKVYNLIASLFPYGYKEQKFVYTNFRTKVVYSPNEKREIEGYRFEAVEGKEFNMFVWNNIWLPVYCCYEIASIKYRSAFASLIDLFAVVEWNRDTNYFSNIMESLCRDLHCYCVQVNTARYGDSCLIRPSKSAEMTILRTKGGINNSILVGKINIKKLRQFQIKEYELQREDREFKSTPPNFKNENSYYKEKNVMFERLEKSKIYE